MKLFAQDLLVTLFGAITSLLTAVILSWVERHFNFAFYSLMVWFVIPAGAVCAGLVASGGYYLGAIVFNHKPQAIILLNMIAISIGTYFLVQYLDYIYVEIEGKRIADYISFVDYWDLTTAHTEMTLRAGRGGHIKAGSVELGSWGYVYAILQILGFALGCAVVFGYLASKVFCKKCSRYSSLKGTASRYTGDGEKFAECLKKLAGLFDEGKFAELITIHANEAGVTKCESGHHLRLDLTIHECKSCKQNHLRMTAYKWNGKDDWKQLGDLKFEAISENALSLTQ